MNTACVTPAIRCLVVQSVTLAKKEGKPYTDWLEHLEIVRQKHGDEPAFVKTPNFTSR